MLARRFQQVVVGRRQDEELESLGPPRPQLPTLSGLGEAPDECFRFDTPPISGVIEKKHRPEVLREGLDLELARAYRAEAERIVASGYFDRQWEERLAEEWVSILWSA